MIIIYETTALPKGLDPVRWCIEILLGQEDRGTWQQDGSCLAHSRQGLQDLMYQESMRLIYVYDKVPCKGIKDDLI